MEIAHCDLELVVKALEEGVSRADAAVTLAEREVHASLDFYAAREQARAVRGCAQEG